MAEIFNLRKMRKAKARREAEAVASQNRAKFGTARPERKRREAEEALAKRHLDGHRRDDPGEQ